MALKYYLIALNLFTFFLFGYDKWCAKNGRRRLQESVLLVITLLGGTFGALLGMFFFKHKTAKKSFILKIAFVIIAQIIIVFIFKERGLENHR